ncbi:MAG: hypothetical protein HOY76_19790 [Streptomyces sp.]|nr:hypothetical protein [Streptomyces sp.]
MPTEAIPSPTAKHWQDCVDVYDFLDQIRLRPGMWLSGSSLRDLQTMLIGYQVALGADIERRLGFPERVSRWQRTLVNIPYNGCY